MAASWRESIDSLISTTSPTQRSSIPIICTTICKSEDLIFEDDDEIEGFITPFVALASHSIGLNVSQCHLHMSSILNASKILLKFCLRELKKKKGFSILSKKQLVSIIEGLCKGHGCLDRTDIVAFSALLKVATIPSKLETVTEDKDKPDDGVIDKGAFFHTLQMAYAACEEESSKDNIKGSESEKSESIEGREKRDAKSQFSNHNIGVVRELSGGQLLLDLCLALPNLFQISALHGVYLTEQQHISLNSICKITISEAPKMTLSIIQGLLSELALISSIVSLPILEPLTSRRINKIALLALYCIDAALTVATGNFVTGDGIAATGKQTKSFKAAAKTVKMEDELEKTVESIVDTSLNIYDTICHVIGASSRTGGQTLQNLHLMTVYTMKNSLMAVLELDGTVKSPRLKDLASFKIKSLQGSNAYIASIASRCIVLLASLMDELQVEGQGIESSEDFTTCGDVTITTNCSAHYRVKRLLEDIPLMQMLLRQFSSLYKKAFSIQSFQSSLAKAKTKTDKSRSPNTSSSDDADSEYISYSEDSSEEEESLLGRFFESTLACPEMDKQPCSKSTEPSKDENERDEESNPDTSKGAHKFLSLATNTLQFVVKHLLINPISEVRQYVRLSFTEQQMSDFAGILNELETGTNKLKDVPGFDHLCVAVDEAIHLMLVEELLPKEYQDSLLVFLGLSPESEGFWPLRIQSTNLGILARVLLARQQKAFKMNKGNMDIPECTGIWFRLIDTLEKAAVAECPFPENQDLNVEHLQLLLFVFHNFSLSQREEIMVLCAKALIRVSNFPDLAKNVPVALSRLLLIQDYFMHHFSNPPKELFTQVQRNLFRPHNAIGPVNEEDPLAETMYFVFMNQEEHNYQHSCLKYYTANGKTIKACDVITMIPRFYDIKPIEDYQNLDSKACDVLLQMKDETNSYEEYYSGVLRLLAAGRECDKMFHSGEVEMTPLDAAFTRHSFGLCWRLLGSLPPSLKYFKSLAGEVELNEKDVMSEMLCNLRWLARFCSKMQPKYLDTFKGWLLKQGMTQYETQFLLDKVAKNSSTLHSSIVIAKDYLEKVSETYDVNEISSISQLPSIFCITLLDVIVAKTHLALSKLFGNTEEDPDLTQIMQVAKELVPTIIKLVPIYQKFSRFYLLSQAANEQKKSSTLPDDKKSLLSDNALAAYSNVMQIGCMRLPKQSSLSMAVIAGLPIMIQNALEKWNSTFLTQFPSTSSWRDSASDEGRSVSIESFLDSLVSAQISAMAASNPFEMAPGLKHTLQSLVQLVADLVMWCPKEQGSIHTLYAKELTGSLCPLLVDAATEYLNETASGILERVVGPADGEQFATNIQFYVLINCQKLLTEQSLMEKERSVIGEEVMLDCLKYIESLIERQSGRNLLENFYTDGRELVKIILSSANCTVSLTYVNKTLKLAVRILQLAEKHPSDSTIRSLARCLSEFQTAGCQKLEEWLKRIVIGIEEDCENTGKMADNRLLLQAFASHLVKEVSLVSEATCSSLLEALLPIGDTLLSMTGSEAACIGAKLSDVIHTASILASADQGKGHSLLCKTAIGWLKTCKSHLENEEIDIKAEGTKESSAMEIAGPLLSYLAEMVLALKYVLEQDTPTSPTLTTQGSNDIVVQDLETEWMDDIAADEEESGGEESDEDSLCNKLCTFTITQKDFMNQHWYHCHTCKMNDGVGVCTICAKVCHKDHDVSYAKYGSFFCDCGAKEDASCQSLVKRTPSSSKEGSSSTAAAAFANGQDLDECDEDQTVRRSKTNSTSSQHIAASVSGVGTELTAGSLDESVQDDASTPSKAIQNLAKQIEKYAEVLVKQLQDSSLNTTILQLLQSLTVPVIETSGPSSQAMGAAQLIKKALEDLHSLDKTVEATEQLMVPTLGSQEGAFENVRMTFSGEQGQAIRQLIGAHVLRRVAMCCLASPKGKRQHLAVSHEKGKITVLQLSALLKQADSSKRKLTLTRLATAQVPFTVLSITGNPCNEDFLAVCGLKDCHVLTFSSSGSVVDHLALHPQLDTGNFIIKAVWLPGSQTELAVVTADFIKIYDLSKDALSPLFYFVLPSGKVRDVSFVFHEHERTMVLMSSAGHIYQQPMDDDSSATGGPFYLTNILPVQHSDLEDTNEQVAGGGVSVYYSHTLQIILFSYTQGKTFMAPWTPGQKEIKKLFPITFKNSNGGNKNAHAALYQWNEVPQHPGLVCCMTHTSGIPVVLMIKPGQVLIQEIKAASSKSKTQDMVAIRHSVNSSDQQRTTMILLCEDGSLRIYMANAEHTGYWMTPAFQPARPLAVLHPAKKKKVCKTRTKSTSVSFPIDFFEHCQVLNDLEFGGPDILHVYNAQQAKHRLMTAGMYLASTKPNGFTIEVINTNPGLVMVGVRVLVGCQSLEKVPSYIEIFGRVIPLSLTRNRWFDLPFTREESLSADKKFTLFFGQSSDPSGVSMVDSIKMYTKTKEVFGWPDDPHEEFASSVGSGMAAPANVVQEKEMISCISPASPFDKLVVHLLKVLDGSFSAFSTTDESARQVALDLATSLMTCSVPSCVQNQAKTLLATLHPSKLSFHNHKDQAQLSQITQYLKEYIIAQQEEKPVNLDVETFQRLVVSGRSVAMSRPANLYRFASLSGIETDRSNHFASLLVDVFWKIYGVCTQVSSIAPLSSIGLQDLESTATALVDIIHAFTISDSTHVPMAVDLYVKMLLCENQAISFSCKQALVRLLHPLQKRRDREGPTPPRSGTPSGERISPEDEDGDDDEGEGERSDSGQEEQSSTERDGGHPAAQPQPGPSQTAASGVASGSSRSSQLESLLLGAAGNLPAVLDLPQDADDEAMMELAIALSLQEQSGGSSGLQLQGLSQGQSSLSLEGGNSSDNTTSAAGSEDEYDAPPSSAQGSSAGHSAPRSPIPPGIAQQGLGSESGGSADSIAVEPGSSVATTSIDGDRAVSEHGHVSSHCSDEQRGCGHSEEEESSHDHDVRHSLQVLLLEELLSHLPHLKEVGGVRAIPFMQVLLMLCSDLEDNDKDIAALNIVLDKCLTELNLKEKNFQEMSERTERHEVQLIVMRFLSVLMSKTKSSAKLASEASSIVCSKTANTLCTVGIVQHCLEVLKCLLTHWQKMAKKDEEEATSVGGVLLKPQAASPPPDMSPFFLRQYVKGHAGDVFESYPQLLTEMVLRLPYQVKKVTDSSDEFKSPEFDEEWMYYLSEYMMVQQTPFVRRQVRKLLLFLCGSKDSYRKQRDLHALDFHCKAVRTLSSQGGFDPDSARSPTIVLSYDSLITMIEHLKACTEIASSRISNWQAYCIQDKSALSFLLRASFLFEEGVAPLILQLLSYAICGSKSQALASSPHKGRKEKDKDREKEKEREKEREKEKEKEKANELSGKNKAAASSLVQQLHEFVDMEILRQFVRNFLLESNSTAVRWQAHELLNKIHKYSTPNQQDKLSDMMWKIWPELPGYGRRAAQFVDLLGYFTIKSSSKTNKFGKYSEKAVQLLKTQNGILENHSNSNVYRMLSGFVEFDGYYLESDPCLVCNNPEVPFQSLKLSAIKADFRFTTTSQLVKLIGSHTISRITLRIADMKRQKMVRAITFHYNNRTVQSVVELKNKRPLWHKAKKCHLTPGQTELKVDFPLPIVACNLMIEYSDFYENFQASSETLQCPRCSASVPANPGVCSNCGENVYQCHKCRSINYDERDPFLCNACGFCKYAKFDYTLTARPCCAVDPIENEEDRKKAVASINSSLERADRVYRQLSSHRTPLDLLLTRILEHGDAEVSKSTTTSQASSTYSSTVQSNTNSTSTVNKAIQSLAYRYCVECKASFDELSKIIQKVLASRKELLEYDCRVREQPLARSISQSDEEMMEHSSTGPSLPRSLSLLPSTTTVVPGKCYGCASAATEHCVTLLRALAMSPGTRQRLVEQGLIRELVDFNLHQGTAQMRADVRHLLCLLTKNNEDATEELNHILVQRVTSALEGHRSNPVMVSGIGPEMLLLRNTIEMEDSCWEQRLRCVMRIFMMSVETPSPLVIESITLSCLKILLRLVKPPAPTSKKNKNKDWDSLGTIQSTSEVRINAKQWLEEEHGFQQWKQQAQKKPKGPKKVGKETKEEARQRYLMEKYANRWRMRMEKQEKLSAGPKETTDEDWLRQVLFTPSSRSARQIGCSIVESLCQVPSQRKQMLDLLTSFLDEVGSAGENASDFFQLYQKLIQPSYLKYYLALQGALMQIGRLITQEINRLSYLEQTTLSSDLSQGYALKMLTELLASFIEHDTLKQRFKGKLVGTVLNGYLSLRRLIVQRTKLIDETQELLLELLEEMTTGTEVETRSFMAICVETLSRYGQDDLRTPVFIFERLCNLIYPEENDVGEFFMTLEKDPQQEDFLQGRMQGNPYSSNEPGLGPLMRDVKNKICTDCELVALLEDDSGMELLINNKIISLDLPVKDVYKKVWCPEGEGEPIKIVYRMRGLLGDATEEFVENLDNSKEEDVDEEEVYRMASVLSVCGGLEAMLTRLSAIRNLSRGRQLAAVILKLLGYAVKLKVNRQYMCNPSLNALNVLLGTLNQALQMEQESSGGGGAAMAEEVLGIMESILQEATSSPKPNQPPSEGDRTQLDMLLDKITSPFVRASTKVLQAMMRIIPFLTFGDEKNMKTLIIHFMPYLDFEKFDVERSSDETLFIDCFCKIANGIENNSSGARLKEMILENGIVNKAIKYLETHTPPKPFSKANLAELDVWKEFLARPSLPHVLRLLCGLCKGYEKIQLIIGESTVPLIHRLEQVSSEEKVGSLAENLQEALRENLEVEKKINEVRRQTRAEKKKLAMAMREKQLGALGMQTTAGDKIIAKPTSLTREMEDLSEESGLACCICREGYKYHPQKVLGIYTFSKRCVLEEFETKQRKTQGYCTVSHFNIVHYDCHMAAVRLARGRDEWESAALQNANTKCNGLLPIWGPQVSESAFASCLARHNSYIQESTGHIEPNYYLAIHDLQLLLQRFAFERSFSDDTGGGGRQSNMHFVPYGVHMILYVLNTTRQRTREEKTLKSFVETPPDKWVESSFEVDSPYYVSLLSLFVYSLDQWVENRLTFLKRLIVAAHARHLTPNSSTRIQDLTVQAYSVYKPALIYFFFIDQLHHLFKKSLKSTSPSTWPQAMAENIRKNDEAVLKACDKVLKTYQNDLLPAESFAEFCDVAELLTVIENPDGFLQETFSAYSK